MTPIASAAVATTSIALAGVLAPSIPAQATPRTVLVRPDGDVIRQWVGSSGTAAAALDDPITQPTAVPAQDYIYAGQAGRITEVSFPAATGLNPQGAVTAWFYANTGATTRLRVDLVSAGRALASTTVAQGAGFGWRSLTSARGATTNLTLRMTALDVGDSNVRAAYASVSADECGSDCGWQQDWSALGETLTDWSSVQVPAGAVPPRLSNVTPPISRHGRALRVELRDGDVALNPAGQPIPGGWRAEAVGPTEHASNQIVRYTWSTLLDASYPATGRAIWQVLSQWHQGDADLDGSPPIAFIVVGDQIVLDLHHPDPARPGTVVQGEQIAVAPLARGRWHDFTVDIRWATSGGSIKVWHNGQLVSERQNIATLYQTRTDRSTPGTAVLKMGLYRKAVPLNVPFILYHDEIRRLRAI